MTPMGYKVPRKLESKDKYKDVWEYLESIEEYDTILQLRELLVKKFGENATPAYTTLHHHIFIDRGK